MRARQTRPGPAGTLSALGSLAVPGRSCDPCGPGSGVAGSLPVSGRSVAGLTGSLASCGGASSGDAASAGDVSSAGDT
ncbi:MAG: hypothetical protein ACLPN6_18800 [Streptosporangiaceae bacterium]